jgi:gluconate 2-dehydrogenase gamma chain
MPFDRRSMLQGSAAAAGLVIAGCEDKPKAAPKTDTRAPGTTALKAPPPPPETPLPPPVIAVLGAVAVQILPSDELGPGAKEADVQTFLDRTLAEPRMRNLHGLLKRGAGFLNKAAVQEHQAQGFVALTAEQQEGILEKLATDQYRPNRLSGPTFMRIMVALTLEGFLSDPSHGGNKDKVGWQFAGYDPDGGRAAVFATAAKGG